MKGQSQKLNRKNTYILQKQNPEQEKQTKLTLTSNKTQSKIDLNPRRKQHYEHKTQMKH